MSSLSCGAVFVKYLLCLFNFAFFVAGGLILALSVWLAVDNTSFLLITRLSANPNLEVYSSPSLLEQAAYVLIAAGALIFLLGFLGCCGAAMESRSLLTTYGMVIIVLFMLQVAGGVMAAVYRTQAEDELEDLLKHSLQKYYSTPQRANAITLAWDAVMLELDCCGVNNYTDFDKAALWQTNKTTQQLVPLACCVTTDNDDDVPLQDEAFFTLQDDEMSLDPGDPLAVFQSDDPGRTRPLQLAQRRRNMQKTRQQKQRAETCVNNPTPANSHYLTGCYGRLKQWSRSNASIILYTVIALGIAELLAILLSFSLCSAVSVDDDHLK